MGPLSPPRSPPPPPRSPPPPRPPPERARVVSAAAPRTPPFGTRARPGPDTDLRRAGGRGDDADDTDDTDDTAGEFSEGGGASGGAGLEFLGGLEKPARLVLAELGESCDAACANRPWESGTKSGGGDRSELASGTALTPPATKAAATGPGSNATAASSASPAGAAEPEAAPPAAPLAKPLARRSVCLAAALPQLNSCRAFKRLFGLVECKACELSRGADQPAVEISAKPPPPPPGRGGASGLEAAPTSAAPAAGATGNGAADKLQGVTAPVPGKCLVSRTDAEHSCAARHPKTRRVCPCSG